MGDPKLQVIIGDREGWVYGYYRAFPHREEALEECTGPNDEVIEYVPAQEHRLHEDLCALLQVNPETTTDDMLINRITEMLDALNEAVAAAQPKPDLPHH